MTSPTAPGPTPRRNSALGILGNLALVGVVAALSVGLAMWIAQVPTRDVRQGPPAADNADSPTAPEPDPQADNSACLDCHLDFADELITASHLEKGFGCTACHGESVAHGEDEGNVTKPDVLFGRAQIDPFCKSCHPEHPATEAYEAFVEEWLGERRPSGVILLDDSTCMDCHGHHILIGE